MKNNKYEEIAINIITTIVMLIILAVIGAIAWFFVYGLYQIVT